ncbi:hypothetical protein EIP91_001051 [Steccherinum ochraceum]|uniref:Fe2OG dioxygenase domain-containing protein n=1 Tax=Steccherinum ochraceum TaxID=92696 RepID=A0A4V2MWM2_9APHY|nr:hypothetical protein EIP91_001051 [Steccherinum ochraceum]
MAKKTKSIAQSPQSTGPTSRIAFPSVSSKEGLECRALLEDQILVIDDFFSPEECKTFVKFIDGLPLEMTPPKKKGEAERVNQDQSVKLYNSKDRISITSSDFAQSLYEVIRPHLPSFPYPASVRRPTSDHTPHSLNSNIRMYKYTPGQHFGCHYDDSVKDSQTGAKSEWTLLIYLSGIEDGVKGGETIFYRDQRGKPTEKIVAPLTRGTALLHRHGHECLLHEGSPVLEGNKYILRSDLMFMK